MRGARQVDERVAGSRARTVALTPGTPPGICGMNSPGPGQNLPKVSASHGLER